MREPDGPQVRRGDIVAGLAAAGVAAGETLLVHSSLSSFGHVIGGADEVIDALLEAVGPEGTVLVPTHTWDKVNLDDPVFDVRATASCVGAITNVFRGRAGAVRSLQPTHSCAGIGPGAAPILEGHETDVTPCGPHSPYARLMERGGKIIFLGTGLSCNTTLHALEEFACVPYLFAGYHDLYSVDRDGRKIRVPTRRHTSGFRRRFGELGPLMAEKGILTESRVGNAAIQVVEAAGMKRLFAPLVARDPFYLLTEDAARPTREWYENRPNTRRGP